MQRPPSKDPGVGSKMSGIKELFANSKAAEPYKFLRLAALSAILARHGLKIANCWAGHYMGVLAIVTWGHSYF